MTSPTTPEPTGSPSRDQTTDESMERPARPGGEVGGHTVQDWEQRAARPFHPRTTTVQEARGGPASGGDQDAAAAAPLTEVEGADEPNPPTTPLYLRPIPQETAPSGPVPAEPFDARTATLTAQSAALVDSLTRGLAEAFAAALRPAVASTVDALIPMMLSLGSVPDDAPPEDGDDGSGTT